MPITPLEIVDSMKGFLEHHVSPKIELKRSFDGRDGVYKVAWVHPAVYESALPLIGELPPGQTKMSAPAIVVMPLETSYGQPFTQGIHLLFCVWNPGDRMEIDDDGIASDIRITSDGWRDLMTLQWLTMNELIQAQTPIGMQLRQPILSGIYNRREDTPDYYPYWWGWMDFVLVRQNNEPAHAVSPGGFSLY